MTTSVSSFPSVGRGASPDQDASRSAPLLDETTARRVVTSAARHADAAMARIEAERRVQFPRFFGLPSCGGCTHATHAPRECKATQLFFHTTCTCERGS